MIISLLLLLWLWLFLLIIRMVSMIVIFVIVGIIVKNRPVINIQALGASRARFNYSGPPSKTYHSLTRKSASS